MNSDYAKKLRELRGEKTIKKVSDDLGILPSTLSNYESGYRVPRDETKRLLADYYGKTVQEIFFDQ